MSPRGKMILNPGAIPKVNLPPNVEHRRRLIQEKKKQTTKLVLFQYLLFIALTKILLIFNHVTVW